jgi:hypothetical protein
MIFCHKCKYYFITWDPKQPHGCRAIGFKSKDLPSRLVFKTSGQKCLKFIPKKGIKSPPTPDDNT